MTTTQTRPFAVNEEQYPFQDHWLERDGSKMHYIDEGAGVPIIMLHGNPTWSFLYRNVIKSLDGTCRSIAPDYPGFGFSDHPPNYGYTPQEHADWVNALIDHLDLDPFILIVQDWGGPIGMSIAVDRPEQVAGLVILNTWCWPADTGTRIFSHIMGGPLGKYLHLRRNFFADKIVPSGINRPEHRTPEIFKAYTDPFPTPESRMGTYVFPWAIRKSDTWLQSIEDKLSLLRNKPIEMVWAMADIAFGKEHIINRWQTHFPDTPIDRIPEAKHYLQEDEFDRVAGGVKRVLARLSA